MSRPAPRTVRYCGRIATGGVAEFKRLLRDNDTTLEIMSLGGALDAPLDMAETISMHGLGVVVIGPCFSACASFVFVAGRKRHVARGGVVGMHHTSTAVLAVVSAAREGRLDARDATIEQRATREAALYARLGVSTRLLSEPLSRIAPQCIRRDGRYQENGENNYAIVTEYGFWIPTREQWRDFGIVVTGYPPRDDREVMRAIASPTLLRATGEITFILGGAPLPVHPSQLLARIGLCTG